MKFILNKKGQSLLEVIVAIAIFGMIGSAMVSMVVGGYSALTQSGDRVKAEGLAKEGIEAIRSIRDDAWNDLIFNESGVATNTEGWYLLGEGNLETIGIYTRKITFEEVCRDGSDNITVCPGVYTDPHTKKAVVTVSWEARPGVMNDVIKTTYLTDWQSSRWTQTNWIGGSGQSSWSDITRYDSDDGHVDVSVSSTVRLATAGGGTEPCVDKIWPFTTSSNYVYSPTQIEVSNGSAKLVYGPQTVSSSWPFTTPSNYSYNDEKIEVSGGTAHLIELESSSSAYWEFVTSTDYVYDNSVIEIVEADKSRTGDIQDTILDSEEFFNGNVTDPDVIHVTGTIYAVIYGDENMGDGFIYTFSMDQDGNIGTVIDNAEYDINDGFEGEILKVSEGIFAIAYRGGGNDGYVITYEIDETGMITNDYIDYLEYDTSRCYQPDFIHISGDVYAVAYSGGGSDGFIRTFSIDSSGNIGGSMLDSWEFSTSNISNPSLTLVYGSVYAVVYTDDGNGGDGIIKTFTIDGSGNISGSALDTQLFESSYGEYGKIIEVGDNVFAVVYMGPDEDGFIKTYYIDNSGAITDDYLYSFEFDASDGFSPDIASIGGSIYAIAYSDPDNYGAIKTVEIRQDGFIGTTAVDTLVYNNDDGDFPFILNAGNGVLLLSHQGASDDGFLSSILVDIAGDLAHLINSQSQNGLISDSLLDTFEFYNGNIRDPDIAHVDGNVYAVVYEEDGSNDGFLITLTIDGSGNVGSVIDTEEYNTSNGREAKIIEVGTNVFAIVHRGNGADGYIYTYNIDSSGNIGNTPIDTLEYDTSSGIYPYILHISGTVYAIAYRGSGNDGWLSTVNIDTSGNIGSVIDRLEFETNDVQDQQSLVHVDGTIYAVAYTDSSSDDGFIRTVQIQNDGQMGSSYIDSFEFDTTQGRFVDLVSISSDIVAVVYAGDGGTDGYVATIEINGSGIITHSVVDSYEFDNLDGSYPEIVHVQDDVYVVAYSDPNDQGFLATLEIQSDGTITHSNLDNFEYDTDDGGEPALINLGGGLFAVLYHGAGDDGFISTFEITNITGGYPTSKPSIYPTAVYSDSYIGSWTSFTETAVKNGGEIYYQLSADNSNWYYWNGSSWTLSSTSTQSNAASVINTNISGFTTSSGQISFKAFLVSDGTQEISLDRVEIQFARTMSGYPSDLPVITGNTPIQVYGLLLWASFETVESPDGTVYYQLSDDGGTTWYYWNGANWAVAGSSNYNIGSDINSNISTFSTSSGRLDFKAFLESDGTEATFVDNIRVKYQGGAPVDDNTVGLWHLDEASGNFIDSSSYGNDLTAVGDITYQQTGEFNYAVEFGGSDDYGYIDDSAQNGLDVTGPLTIDAWVYHTSADYDGIAVKWGTGGNRSYQFYITELGGMDFMVRNGGSQGSISASEDSVSLNEWHHIAAVYSGSYLYLFVDGNSVATPVAYSAGIQDGNYPFLIGDYGGESFNGLMDEVRVSNVARWTDNFVLPTQEYGGGDFEYPTDHPTIEAATPYTPESVDQWTDFLASVSSTSGGSVYFQLSSNNGATWKYWDGGQWATSTGYTDYNTAADISDHIWEFDAVSKSITFKAFFVSDGVQQIELDEVEIDCANRQYEIGSVSADENWTTVNLNNNYKHPVILTTYYENNNTSTPASVRINNVTSTAFDVRLQNPSGANLLSDQINYFVIEKGKWDIGGISLEADTYNTSQVAYKNNWNYDTVDFGRTFASDPIVMHQVMSYNDSNWITSFVSNQSSRTSPPGTDGIGIALNGAEAVSSHAEETIAWLALERDQTGTVDSVDVETYRTGDTVQGHDDGCYYFNFQNSYSATPLVILSQQEMDGNDGSWGVMCDVNSSQAAMHADEDQVSDSEMSHTGETFAFMAFEQAFSTTTASGGGGGGGGVYHTDAWLISSAFDTGNASTSVETIEWDEDLTSCAPNCQIKFQMRSASALVGPWTNWYGFDGIGTYFTTSTGSLIPTALNEKQWLQYRTEFSGNGNATPILEEVRIEYN